jgi:23S rRNA maturation-related 3'-5' exoribonuclease YhaM
MDEKDKPVNNYSDKDEDIIELTDVVDSPEIQESDIIIKDLDDDTEIDNFQKDDFTASLGLKIDDGVIISEDISETVYLNDGQGKPEKISVSSKQIEEAIERVVQKMLGEKIDGILYKVIERAVSQEIIRLKNILHVNEEDID